MAKAKDLAKKIEASLPEISKAVADAEVVGINDLFAAVHRRIFIEGRKTNGALIGVYSDKYKKTRLKFGRINNSFVDLNLTDQLMNSLGTGTLGGKPAYGFIIIQRKDETLTNPELADDLEKRYGIIFKPSEEERMAAIETAKQFLFDKLRGIVRSWS